MQSLFIIICLCIMLWPGAACICPDAFCANSILAKAISARLRIITLFMVFSCISFLAFEVNDCACFRHAVRSVPVPLRH